MTKDIYHHKRVLTKFQLRKKREKEKLERDEKALKKRKKLLLHKEELERGVISIETKMISFKNFNINKKISNLQIKQFWVSILKKQINNHYYAIESDSTYKKDFELIGDIGSKLIMDVITIDGISQIILSPFCLSIEIENNKSWRKIEPLILEILKKLWDKPEQVVVGEYKTED